LELTKEKLEHTPVRLILTPISRLGLALAERRTTLAAASPAAFNRVQKKKSTDRRDEKRLSSGHDLDFSAAKKGLKASFLADAQHGAESNR
jgi:hypothetical protein